jgi:MoaA/NifB/PqqE/SkfB family radical SAM enzyme
LSISPNEKNISASFCILPWIHFNVMPDSTVIPCCISPYDDIYGDGKKQSTTEIWNSEKFKDLRLKMLKGETISGCNRCTNLECSGFRSMRQEMNSFFKSHLNLVNMTQEDGSLSSVDFKYVDIRFSNLCNFKCRSCGPILSSAWYEDSLAMFPGSTIEKKLRSVSIESPSFWRELSLLIPGAEVIYFGGGEPLISKEHYEILSLLNAQARHDIELRYNTNLSQLNYGNYNLSDIWSNFDKVALSISIDDIGPRAEYFRHGTKWESIEKNFDTLMRLHPKIERYVNCTINILNVYYLPEIYDYLISKNFIEPINFNINLLLNPDELRIDVLPAHLKKIVTIRLKKFKFKIGSINKMNPLIKDLDNIINFMNQSDKSHLLPAFKTFTCTLDKLRKENFIDIYPEMEDLLLP